MADDNEAIDDSTLDGQSSQFLEILCTTSGKNRRFSTGTEAGFALQLINKKLDSGVPLALYIEAAKEGEEPVSFGLKSLLTDYGDGWKLHTVTTKDVEGFEKMNDVEPALEQLPDVIELVRGDVQSATNYELHHMDSHLQEHELARDDVQSATNNELQLINPCLQEENKAITSEPVSDTESQSFAKWDFTDMFTTDKVFNSREELINWARDVGRAVESVIIIKKSSSALSGRRPRICFGCEKGDKRRKYKKKKSDKETLTRRCVSKKCECPFLLRGVKMRKDDQWMVKVECGYHNHPVEQGSSIRRKLTAEEKELVINMSRAGIRGKEILQVLRDRDALNETPLRMIYNTQAKLRNEMYGTSQCNSS